ncbi:MAG: GNAT family N-acetyltransferase [Methanobacterium sp.]
MSVKLLVKEHFTNSPLSEHFKKHARIYNVKSRLNTLNYYETIEMRNFTSTDMDACVDLYKNVFNADPWNDVWKSRDQVRDYLEELIGNPVFVGFVVFDNSKIIAACLGHKRSWWAGREFFIDELFVSDEMQEKGIGTRLLEYVECNPLLGDCQRLILLTNRNMPAKEFYLKKGFNIKENRIMMGKNIS